MEELFGQIIYCLTPEIDPPGVVRTWDKAPVVFTDESFEWIAVMLETFPEANYFVAPESPACGCSPHPETGDVPCHICKELVNVRCWQCGTFRGDGPCPNAS